MAQARTAHRPAARRRNHPTLLSEGRIGSMTLKNRMIVTAMGVSLAEDGRSARCSPGRPQSRTTASCPD
jgi:hypothetical protein